MNKDVKGPSFKMLWRATWRGSAVLYVLISVSLAVSIFFMQQAVSREVTLNLHLAQARKLSSQLGSAIITLSKEARSYVQTLDEKHLHRYSDMLNVDNVRDRIIRSIIELDPSSGELEKIEQAKARSDALIRTERRALGIMTEELSISPEEKRAQARKLLLDPAYRTELEYALEPVILFQRMIGKRLRQEMLEARKNTSVALVILIGLAVFIPVLLTIDITKRRRVEEKLVQTHEELVKKEKRLEEILAELRQAHLDLSLAQSRLVQTEKLATIAKLAEIVSREFSKELEVMKHAAYLLKQKMASSYEEDKKNWSVLEERILDMDHIIENMMTYGKTPKPDLQPTHVLRVLLSIIGKIKVPSNIKIDTRIEEDLPEFQADEAQLRQILINIMVNALQAMQEKGGRLVIQAGRFNYFLQIVFEDTGPGMPDEVKQHIFEPLFSTKSRGAGLGLATAKLLVEGHGGTIDIESKVGKGTQVIIQLPM